MGLTLTTLSQVVRSRWYGLGCGDNLVEFRSSDCAWVMSSNSLENFRSIGRHFVYIVYITDLLHSLECTIGMYKYFVKL